MSNPIFRKSKTPLQFKVFHTLLGFTVFFSLITVPAEKQIISIFGIHTASELLWWPIVFFGLRLINSSYGFAYFRHTVYLVILFHAIYILFLKFAIWLPASSFWKLQSTYTEFLGRDFVYLVQSSLLLWACLLLPMRFSHHLNQKYKEYIFWMAFLIFCLLEVYWLNFQSGSNVSQLIIPLLIFGFLNIFHNKFRNFILYIEKIDNSDSTDTRLFSFRLPQATKNESQKFRYHHFLFCSSIVFFIASKTMAAKFITLGFLTINVGGIVFSLAYLAADMMTDVYGMAHSSLKCNT